MKALNLYSVYPREGKFFKLSGAQSATAYYKNHAVDLISGEKKTLTFTDLMHDLDRPYQEFTEELRVVHFFYEAGFDFNSLSEEIDPGSLLALDITYSAKTDWTIESDVKAIMLTKKTAPLYQDYLQKFNKGYAHLQAGDCYQFNLTEEFTYEFDKHLSPDYFLNRIWKEETGRGEFAFATYSECLQKLFLSNSPECLFSIIGDKMISRPIKGTVYRQSNDPLEIERLWSELSNDKKSQAELYMITDLIRNDLSRIDLPRAKVIKKKEPLLVPKMLHQYSEVQLQLREHVTLKKMLVSLFPGGSITGAPKKRVMQILRDLEKRTRGFYCGTTLTMGEELKASINIRSAVVDYRELILSYQAGGGITLLSRPDEEFKELTYKHDSFVERLTL